MLSAEARPKVAVEGIGQMWQLALEQIGAPGPVTVSCRSQPSGENRRMLNRAICEPNRALASRSSCPRNRRYRVLRTAPSGGLRSRLAKVRL